jgi:hypothetical protein
VFTARYALSPYIKHIRFVFKGLILFPWWWNLVNWNMWEYSVWYCNINIYGRILYILLGECCELLRMYNIGDEWMNEWMNECGILVDGYWQATTEVPGEKCAPMPLCPPQISRELAWDRANCLSYGRTWMSHKTSLRTSNLAQDEVCFVSEAEFLYNV